MAKTPTQTFFDKAATDPDIAKKSRGWFNKEVVRLRQMRPQPKQLMKQAGRSTRLLPGRLYMFQYEAKRSRYPAILRHVPFSISL